MEQLKVLYDKLAVGQSPWVDSMPLMSNPFPVFGILAAYLYFVLHAGPKMMKNRKPMDLKWILIVYNAGQVLYSLTLVLSAFHRMDLFLSIFTFGCRATGGESEELQSFVGSLVTEKEFLTKGFSISFYSTTGVPICTT